VIILGVDPGTASLGYGVIERTGSRLRAVDYGVLHTSPQVTLPERLVSVHRLVSDLIELHAPAVVGVERLFFSRNAQTAFAVGQARGVVLLAAAQHSLEVREATPNVIKSAIAGYGAADKEQVQRMVQLVLGLPERPRSDDAADALAMAIWVAHTERPGERLNSGLLDRSAIAPLGRGETPYERAVHEAVDRERAAAPTDGEAGGSRRRRAS